MIIIISDIYRVLAGFLYPVITMEAFELGKNFSS